MKYRITSDPHFHHELMLKLWRPKNYEDKIFKNLQSIPKEDTLICLWDVCLGNEEEIHNKYIVPLKCKKVLVLGNHDHKSYTWYYQHWRDFVCETFELRMYWYRLVFTHKPILEELLSKDIINVHGHIHARNDYIEWPNRVLYTQEEQNYVPKPLAKLIWKKKLN